MKVRKFLLAGALLVIALFSVNSVMAETPTTTDNVKVNLKFMPVQSIVVNAASDHQEVDFVFQSSIDYTNGVEVAKKVKHLKVFSSGGFQVSLQTSGGNFTSANTAIEIPVSDVTVTATASAGDGTGFVLGTDVQLTNTPTPFITSDSGGSDLEFDVKYSNPGFAAAKYINGYDKEFLTDGATVFTTTLTYTIATN